ncbi:4Fe-4S dicluster domain-containing protein [Calderihabitans maritimus]|uniref:4Fe-4S ferredoxin-type domain-containing protein n=1 Tax=Calderihabitans maritimus TaxID=1246530 RepID=A0A1Z5HPK9_9FIRM|nr:4Fe-4S binding protein [Calderihabitans maritimus]GAW91459.1 hypothetical protein KKC1_06210 [Calderihabitans maritimus]
MGKEAVKYLSYEPKVNYDLCKCCRICVSFCPQHVLTVGEKGYPERTFAERCTGCRQCFYRCPDFAIEVEVKSS